MAGKRASMREGPLAALFRRTEEEGLGEKEKPRQEAAPARPAPVPERREPQTPPRGPGERLREVFSPDIPENVLEPPRRWEPETAAGRQPIQKPILRVVGVGGAGVNAVDRMIDAGVEGVEFIAINTALQSLEYSRAHVTLHIGNEVTRGLGSGSDPELGRQSALEEYDRIKSLLKGADMIFITAGAGGGTGTGAAPVVARLAKDVGALSVGIVTKPFSFEGS